MVERWKDVSGYEGCYQVSDRGRVRSLCRVIVRSNGYPQTIRARFLKASRNHYRHLVVGLQGCQGLKTKRIYQLVLEAFVGPRPCGLEACHNNGKHDDNRLRNLRWDTHAANMADTAKHGVRRGYKVRRSDGKTYRTCEEAAVAVGVNRCSVARSIRLGQHCAGFTWEIISG